MTVLDIFRQIVARPDEWLLRKWNWKSAIFSPGTRAIIFLVANLGAGWRAAVLAMLAELTYRCLTAGFYGALTQAFRKARPIWAANLTVMLFLPILQHSIEYCVHVLRGTPKLLPSMLASICFTAVTTLFNLYAMRQGALVVGSEADSVLSDLKRMPRLILGFVSAGPIALYSWLWVPTPNFETRS